MTAHDRWLDPEEESDHADGCALSEPDYSEDDVCSCEEIAQEKRAENAEHNGRGRA